jgi:hypothetical protein
MTALEIPQFRLEIDGTEYRAEVARCVRFTLEVEDHGLFTAMVTFEGSGWGQGIPPHALDEYDSALGRRVGTAFGCDYIIECCRVLGSPEQAAGRRVVVLRKAEEGSFGNIAGFARLNDDGSIGEPFFPQKLAYAHFPQRVTVEAEA